MFGVNPAAGYVVTFAAVVPIWVKLMLSVESSTLNPVSLLELSVQLRLIWLELAGVAVRLEGAVGGWVSEDDDVVAVAVLE